MLAIGIMRILIERNWIDAGYIASRTTGFEELRAKVMSTDLAEVERVTGVPRSQMFQFAELYHTHRPGLIHIGVGLQRNSNGGEMVAAICMLGALTGQIGTRGGGVLYANMDWALNDISYSELRTAGPVMHNMVRLGQDLTESDAIKALYVYNQNPAATIPNQNLVRQGLRRDDLFVVVHDLFMTDTARLADVVLPATTYAESADLHLSYWHDYVRINNPAIAPMGEARSNHWVFSHIGQRMGYQESCFYQTEDEVIEEALIGTGLDADELRRRAVLWGDPDATSFEDARFPTPSGRLTMIVPDFTAPAQEPHRYRFITPKSVHLQGSQVFNVPRKWSALREPLLLLHPDDAAAEGIADGDPVRVWNERGEVRLLAQLSPRCQPGVVVSYMVRWGDNANTTTSEAGADMGGNSTFHTNFVSLARLGEGESVADGAESVAEAARLAEASSRS
jgi:anaerobic selenocysteine-containing dehydrogenase